MENKAGASPSPNSGDLRKARLVNRQSMISKFDWNVWFASNCLIPTEKKVQNLNFVWYNLLNKIYNNRFCTNRIFGQKIIECLIVNKKNSFKLLKCVIFFILYIFFKKLSILYSQKLKFWVFINKGKLVYLS